MQINSKAAKGDSDDLRTKSEGRNRTVLLNRCKRRSDGMGALSFSFNLSIDFSSN